MANYEINEEQEVLTKAMRMIETGDPVHADVYNVLFSALLNNDVFLEKLANKMVQQAMISHVMDSTNSNMVLGADQGPVITKLIDKVQEQVTVLNTKGKIYYASGSKNAEYKVETGLVEVTVPAGKYLVLAANSVTTPNTGQMSCGLGASSGTLIGENTTRTESTSGGGVVNFAYLDTDNISTIKTSGYGYNDESYMYRSILVAIRL